MPETVPAPATEAAPAAITCGPPTIEVVDPDTSADASPMRSAAPTMVAEPETDADGLCCPVAEPLDDPDALAEAVTITVTKALPDTDAEPLTDAVA